MKKIKSLLQKTRKVRVFVWKGIRKNTPLSSEIHCYVKNRKGLHGLILANLSFVLIETNPGPSVYLDATKTVNAPYCQGNVTVFGENAGQQCVAMSLCALIYSKITKITSVDDMTQIMIVGIQLYSSLPLLVRQSVLMLTELPGMVTVFERFFQLEYSESYTCNMVPELRGITTVYATGCSI